MTNEVTLRSDVRSATSEPHSGVRLAKLRDGKHTWSLTLLAGNDPAELRAALAALRELDAELERAYGEIGDPSDPPPRGST